MWTTTIFMLKTHRFLCKKEIKRLILLGKNFVDNDVEKGTPKKKKRKELIEDVNVNVFTDLIYPGVKPITFLFIQREGLDFIPVF